MASAVVDGLKRLVAAAVDALSPAKKRKLEPVVQIVMDLLEAAYADDHEEYEYDGMPADSGRQVEQQAEQPWHQVLTKSMKRDAKKQAMEHTSLPSGSRLQPGGVWQSERYVDTFWKGWTQDKRTGWWSRPTNQKKGRDSEPNNDAKKEYEPFLLDPNAWTVVRTSLDTLLAAGHGAAIITEQQREEATDASEHLAGPISVVVLQGRGVWKGDGADEKTVYGRTAADGRLTGRRAYVYHLKGRADKNYMKAVSYDPKAQCHLRLDATEPSTREQISGKKDKVTEWLTKLGVDQKSVREVYNIREQSEG